MLGTWGLDSARALQQKKKKKIRRKEEEKKKEGKKRKRKREPVANRYPFSTYWHPTAQIFSNFLRISNGLKAFGWTVPPFTVGWT